MGSQDGIAGWDRRMGSQDGIAGWDLDDCSARQVLGAKDHAKAAGLPFFITEYNDGLGGTSRDDSSAAAFVIRNVGILSELDMVSGVSGVVESAEQVE